MSNGIITYSYQPETWDQEKFLALGGFTVVFLNYNKKAQITKSVASALNQDFPLLEMFFMDDASSDGSGDVMERLTRAYCGRHKVTIVRNTENQRIIGQWNIVSKLATGNWLGMFCADDIANPNRVSLVAKKIREYPSLKGLCTSGIEHDYITGREGRHIGPTDVTLVNGTSALDSVLIRHGAVCGATAFWHRSLFVDSLPPGPYDDEIIRWILHFKGKGEHKPIWLYDGTLETITYGVGTGISSVARSEVSEDMPDWKRWIRNHIASRKYHKMLEESWNGVLDYYKQHHADGILIATAKGMTLGYRLANLSWFRRLMSIGTLCAILTNRTLSMGFRFRLLRIWWRLVILELLGLHFLAFSCCLVHRVRGRSYRQICKEMMGQ